MKAKEKEIRILLLGLDNAGKTTLIRNLTHQSLDHIEPTLGFQIHTLPHDTYHLNVWDVGGQRTLRSYWRNYFEQTDGLIWVVDSTDVERLEDCREELFKLLRQEKLVGASLLIFANKQDLGGAAAATATATGTTTTTSADEGGVTTTTPQQEPNNSISGNALSVEQISKVLQLNDDEEEEDGPFRNRHWSIHACSAVTGQGLVEGLDWMVKDVASRIFMHG